MAQSFNGPFSQEGFTVKTEIWFRFINKVEEKRQFKKIKRKRQPPACLDLLKTNSEV